MANKKDEPAESSSRLLGLIWLVASLGLAYPAHSLLVSWGFNSALAAVTVFLAACLLYDIPYRARVRAENQAALRRGQQWRT